MGKGYFIAASISIFLGSMPCAAGQSEANAPTEVLWDVARSGLFDRTNKAYLICNGVVEVELGRKNTPCPTGLGHLASGMDTVRTIRLLFDCSRAGEYWLHVCWNPGGSGDEQFSVSLDGEGAAESHLLHATQCPNKAVQESFRLQIPAGRVSLTLNRLSGDGLHFEQLALSKSSKPPHPIRPDLKYPTIDSFQKAIGQKVVVLEGDHVMLFAPTTRAEQAKIVFDLLVKAYDALYEMVGVHTPYKIVVYHFPDDHPDGWGGTSSCVIWYGCKNLNFDSFEEWRRCKIPHVCGYIEEMAHNFVSATGVQFGWEMVGWSIGVKATEQVAANPIFAASVAETRRGQLRTFTRYVREGYVFPADLPANKVDRIHAHILNLCEKRYGENFWRDFFAEVRKARDQFDKARSQPAGDMRRNARYTVTLECFDQLKGLKFTEILKRYHISLTTDVKSLYPESTGWNRRLEP